MPGRYKAYPTHKESGVEWIKRVPANWEILSGRRIFINRRGCSRPDDVQLAASQRFGVVPQELMMEMNAAKVMLALKGTDSFKHVEKSDFVISLRSFEGGIEYSDYSGCVSPAYTVLSASKQINAGFFRHLFKSAAFISALQATTDSLRDGKSITYEQFGKISLVMPSVIEQEKIAQFLDHETGKIDALIEKQQQLIKLLQEKRQAVISHAVTKGLNPDAPMKDSGVEWLGQVPAHWAIKELRYLTTQIGGGTPNKDKAEYWNGSIPWVSPKDMKVDYIFDSQDKISPKALSESSTKLVPKGSVLIVVRGMILLHSVPVALTMGELTINQDMKALVAKDSINCEYLLFLLKGFRNFILDLVESSAHGTMCLRTEGFERMKLALPSVFEQKNIVIQLKEKLLRFDSLLERANQAIHLLQERRMALISAAVTGKIDVRDWQAPADSTAFSSQNPPITGRENDTEMCLNGGEVADD
ncbi:MAG: hypothetical protein ACD_39C01021G0002 [uncultured bacterium]|nr:MAG: hypothetical protein ACD_39C01021G0002 [uncultured bacterium]